MRILSFDQAQVVFDRRYQPSDEVAETVQTVISAVRERGDAAVLEFTAKFDGAEFSSARHLRVSQAEFQNAAQAVSPDTRQAIGLSRENVTAFAEQSLRQDWTRINAQGAEVGELFQPFERVGIYVPGGTAPLISTVNMTVAIAQSAGCPEIVVCTPAGRDGSIHPAMLYALQEAGAAEVYKIGGAQAIAAMAHGTDTIRPVAKIFGPGNAYVMEAKRQAFGAVAIDLLPGPSEILILADHTGNAAWIASDLLAQAEHGSGSCAVLVTTSETLIPAVEAEVARQAAQLSRQEQLQQALEQNCLLVSVASLDQAVELANSYAPEHLSLVVENESAVLPRIRTAGAIFAGPYSPVAAGDFLTGPSHELPTGGAGKSFSGLTADQFQRRTSLVRVSRQALQDSATAINSFAEAEGLDAHGASVSIRLS